MTEKISNISIEQALSYFIDYNYKMVKILYKSNYYMFHIYVKVIDFIKKILKNY